MNLYDLIASSPDLRIAAETARADDARLSALLRALPPADRRVVLAWSRPGVATWTDAAWYAGAADPAATGEQVRRRVRRLVLEQHRRSRLRQFEADGRNSEPRELS
ncbi:hypothetical protein AB0D49_29400 [Streptomyces sp. NPDC048290]|uniref:hypothetical protein n=1 Tax=Streptomyces sp. NPDC048290 TaxID=3155811 RepID=UPI00341EA174